MEIAPREPIVVVQSTTPHAVEEDVREVMDTDSGIRALLDGSCTGNTFL